MRIQLDPGLNSVKFTIYTVLHYILCFDVLTPKFVYLAQAGKNARHKVRPLLLSGITEFNDQTAAGFFALVCRRDIEFIVIGNSVDK